MNRNEKRKARIVALQVIYANEISKVDPDSMLSYIANELDVGNQSSILNYSMELINLTIDNKSEIDQIISKDIGLGCKDFIYIKKTTNY